MIGLNFLFSYDNLKSWEKFAMGFFQEAQKKKYLLAILIMLMVMIASLAWLVCRSDEEYFLDRAPRVAFLLDELTTTSVRQQRALDEIGKDEDGAFIYLIKYLDDQRMLADNNVMFLNTHSTAFEKYFHTGGTRVGETILRYLCWKTMKCDVSFDPNDEHSITLQKEKIKKYCKERFVDPKFYEN